MNQEKYHQIKELLESYGSLSISAVQDRLCLIQELDRLIGSFIGDVKGITVFGSLLNDKFNPNSDIDFAVVMNSKKNCLNDELRVKRAIESETGRKASPYMPYGMEDIPRNGGEFYLNTQHVPFGVYIGEESFRKGIITNILEGFRVCQKESLWPKVQEKFEWWGNKDLSNPEGNYKLSVSHGGRNLLASASR